jgi:hypothetical protein
MSSISRRLKKIADGRTRKYDNRSAQRYPDRGTRARPPRAAASESYARKMPRLLRRETRRSSQLRVTDLPALALPDGERSIH